MSHVYRVGCAAGFSGDRLGVARPIVDEFLRLGEPACLIFESLAERTLALAQLELLQNPSAGYEPLLAEMLEPILADCVLNHIPIVGNFGAANPEGAARLIARMAKAQGLPSIKIAIVKGDVIAASIFTDYLSEQDKTTLDQSSLVSANVYLGFYRWFFPFK